MLGIEKDTMSKRQPMGWEKIYLNPTYEDIKRPNM